MNTLLRKPPWLRKKIDFRKSSELSRLLRGLGMRTVGQESLCPNISECFAKGTATFLILGNICTRNCRFCNIKKGKPGNLDLTEPRRLAEAVRQMNLTHVVITSVTRDDLPDGGAGVFSQTILELRRLKVSVEVLIPDFKGSKEAVKEVIGAGPDVIACNLETVPRLYQDLRDGDYEVSLEILRFIKQCAPGIFTKSGLMLGLGEEEQEVLDVFSDLAEASCDFLSIGQYLAPTAAHYAVKDYLRPERFNYYKDKAYSFGMRHVLSGPYVRSSYHAQAYIDACLPGGRIEFEGRMC